jgi:cytochrome P450
MTVTEASVYYDPYDIGINADPYPTYHRLLEEAPAYYNDRYDFWCLSRHADVERALTNWESFSNTHSDILDIMKADIELPRGVLLFEDPPEHTVLRRLMARVFSPKRVAVLEDEIRDFAGRCLDPLVGSGGFDIITEFASVLPMRVIGMLLGIPEQDQVSIRNKTDDNLRTKPGARMQVRQESVANGDMFGDYIDWRAKNPSDDVMTMLLNAEYEDADGSTRRLSRDDVLTYCAVLAGAGNETTGRLIGWITKVLAEHPDQRAQVHADRTLLPNVIDEILRFEPTGHASARWVNRDLEYHGVTIPKDSALLLMMGAANRDPRRYQNPDTFDINRKDGGHLTFGFGLHYCLGANLARIEGRVALDEMLNRWPEWDVDLSGANLAPTSTVRGWEHLPVVLP